MFKIGADPELFLINKEKKFISSIGLFGGTKENPKPIGNNCAIQEDNVAVEFNIPACATLKEFQQHIAYSLREINQIAKTNNLKLATSTASAIFPEDQLDNIQARIFGCDPDYNAWTEKMNPKPKTKNENLRSAGGHVHLGIEKLTIPDKINLIKIMDLYLGIPSILLDNDRERRLLYGKAGCFRFKDYGVEYRTLSNFWIWKKNLVELVYKNTKRAVIDFMDNKFIPNNLGNEIQICINNGDENAAKHLNRLYKLI